MDVLQAGADPTPPRPMASSTPLPSVSAVVGLTVAPATTAGAPSLASQHRREPTPPAPLAAATPLPAAGIPRPTQPPFHSGSVKKGEAGSPERGACLLPPASRTSPPRAYSPGQPYRPSSTPLSLPMEAESPYIAPRPARSPAPLVRQSLSPIAWFENVAAADPGVGESLDQSVDGAAAQPLLPAEQAPGVAQERSVEALADMVAANEDLLRDFQSRLGLDSDFLSTLPSVGGSAGDRVVLGDSFAAGSDAGAVAKGWSVAEGAQGAAMSPDENSRSNGMAGDVLR